MMKVVKILLNGEEKAKITVSEQPKKKGIISHLFQKRNLPITVLGKEQAKS